MLLLLAACAAPGPVDSAEPVGDSAAAPHPWGDPDVPDGGPVTVSGHAFSFGLPGGRIEGATVGVLELPDFTTTTGEDGAWTLSDLPRGAWATFTIAHPDFAPLQTGTFLLGHPDSGGDVVEQVTFQVPNHAMFDVLAASVGVTPSSDRCQVASTITRRGHSLYGPGATHGEPEATAALGPDRAVADGPIYFDLLPSGAIYPSRELIETTHDGGVLWVEVEPGDHLLTADRVGATVRPARVRCTPGMVVNPSPPWGLQVLTGGLEPDE